ncbi:hypothetical protein TRIUR3_02144 [Triticum urartu]|uniref:Senescence domain-containing protein n=1 Tax=Triticum urartu TaxID=4572 RepID=M7Z5U8_TRIUA|nr:hypothetical protein TRIUR3_02144 [Triticum urartu]
MTVDRLRWGQEVLRKRIQPGDTEAEVSPEMLRRIKRAKKVTKMSEKVATGILSGVVKLTSSVTSSLVNSKAGKKFFSLLPGELYGISVCLNIILENNRGTYFLLVFDYASPLMYISLVSTGKISDAVEVAGKDVLSTSSTVTTGLVSHKYGEKAAAATNEGLDAAGHAIGTAWAVFKLRQALNPKSGLKPTSLAKSSIKAGAAELRAKSSKSK